MTTHVDPPFPLARLRGRGWITGIRDEHLRFDAEETAGFLNGVMSLDLSQEVMSMPENRTEGWATGLQLAAISLQNRQRESEQTLFAETFGGTAVNHKPVLDEDLFEKCQKVRARRRRHKQPTNRYNHYLLRDLAYCHRCCSRPPEGKTFRNYGKLRCQAQKGGRNRYYRCRANELGYDCDQPGVPVEEIDEQVVAILKRLKPPKNWKSGVTAAVGEMLQERNLDERLAEIQGIIKRMDQRWDHGFFTNEEEYIKRRLSLQQELEQLTPIPDNDLEQAANLLANFGTHWERLADDPEAQRDLLKLIVQRVYIDGHTVKAMTLSSNYHLVLGNNTKGPTEFSVDPFVYTSGSDGTRARTRIPSVIFIPPMDPQSNLKEQRNYHVVHCAEPT